MSRQAFAIGWLALFPLFCFGAQPVPGSDAALSGLCGPVHTVFTEISIYNDNGQRSTGPSKRATYDRTGYETELYQFDSRGALRQHTVYTRNGKHLVKTETTSPPSPQKSVQIFNSAGAVTETDTYDGTGMLISKTVNHASDRKHRRSLSTTKSADGSISTLEIFRDGSFKEHTVKPDGTTFIHFHSVSVDWRQVTDSHSRSLDYIEEPSTGKYLRISSQYEKDGRERETNTYDRSGKPLGQTTFQYPREDVNGNWTEQQIWARSDGKTAQLLQVTYRAIAYYQDPDGQR